VPVWLSAPQAHSRVSNINFGILIFVGETLLTSHEYLATEGKVLSHLGFRSKILQALNSVKGPGNTLDINPN
jgi:hypothetical protein